MAIAFTCDTAKKESNRVKHGVSFEEAMEALSDPLAYTVVDVRHPASEVRFFSVGRTLSGRVVVVGFADYGDVVRIITARMATRRERQAYEEEL